MHLTYSFFNCCRHALRGVDVTWIVRHGHIGDAFFDVDAAKFLLEELQQARTGTAVHAATKQAIPSGSANTSSLASSSSNQGTALSSQEERKALGHAVGPAWTRVLAQDGAGTSAATAGAFSVELRCEVTAITPTSKDNGADGTYPLEVSLSDGRSLSSDVVISVIGVDPAVDWVPAGAARSAHDGGLIVGRDMCTSIPGIYAAGDACTMEWAAEISPHWFQMRLWSQARAQGVYAAHCMAGVDEDMGSDMAFEMFTHVTRFLGKKVKI